MSAFFEVIVLHTTWGGRYTAEEWTKESHGAIRLNALDVSGVSLHGATNKPGWYTIPQHSIKLIEELSLPRSYDRPEAIA